MDIARLNVRITIQQNTTEVDVIGNHRNVWSDHYTCHATISGESPNEDTDAGMIVDNAKADFTIRWCRRAAGITAERHRVVYGGEIYNILGIDHMNNRRRSIKLKCQKVRR